MNDYMVLIWAARKAEGENEQKIHNNSCTSKAGMVSDVPMGNEGNTDPDPEPSPQEPWVKWVEMQQQFNSLMVAVKGAQNAPQKPHNRDLIRFREITIKIPNNNSQRPQRQMLTKITQVETMKIRLVGKWWKPNPMLLLSGLGAHATQVFQHLKCKALKLQDGGVTAEPAQHLNRMWNQCQCQPQLIKVVTGPQYHNLAAAVELTGEGQLGWYFCRWHLGYCSHWCQSKSFHHHSGF